MEQREMLEEKQIRRWLRRRFTAVGWSLVIYYGILYILATIAVNVEIAPAQLGYISFSDLDISELMSNGWGYITGVLSGLAILYGWKGPDFFGGKLIERKGKMRIGVFFAMVLLSMGCQAMNTAWVLTVEAVSNAFGGTVMDLVEMVSGSKNSFSMFLYASFLAPISEEILFRGLCLRTLEPFGKKFAILGSAVAFGVFHGNVLQIPFAFLMGLILGYVAMEYSIFWAVALHMFNNLVIADLQTRALSLLPIPLQNVIDLGLMGGCVIGSIVLLALKSQEIREYNAEAMDRRCLKCFFGCSGMVVLFILVFISMVWTL